MPALVGLLFKWGETNDKHVSGFANGPEACVVQMITVSAFASITEPNNENITKPNQRLFNKNNFAIISSFDLMTADLLITIYLQAKLVVTYNLYLLINHSVPGIGLSNEHITLEEKCRSSLQSVFLVDQLDTGLICNVEMRTCEGWSAWGDCPIFLFLEHITRTMVLPWSILTISLNGTIAWFFFFLPCKQKI